ncbi:MAG: tetratricopeptide (TPR) repeat protein [Candidatus Paceibacteria bacterium]|jgi:tetratricopeptide (TPR) repeat protein
MMFIASVGVALLLALGGPAQDGAPGILERNPSEWARAKAGYWAKWDADSTPPQALQPFLLRAIDAYRLGDMPSALEALYELLEKAPDFPSGLHQSGVIYFRLRRYGDAIVAFERYIEVAPQGLGDTRALGHCYYTLGNYKLAQKHYLKVLKIHSQSVEARRGLALALMRLGQADASLKQLQQVLKLDPRHANAATWIAQILFDEERVKESLEAALKARDLDPFEARPWFLLSQIHFDLGQDEEGETCQARFSTLNQIAQELRAAEARLLYDPRQAPVYLQLISLHRQAGDLQRAGNVLNRWLKVEPARLEIRIMMLDLAEQMGDGKGAALLAENLHKLARDHVPAWERLLRYYSTQRDRVHQIEAERELERLRSR